MSQRIAKVESQLQQIVAQSLRELWPEASAGVTVTAAKVARDLKTAIIWVSVFDSDEGKRQNLFKEIIELREQIQAQVAKVMTTKFTPRLSFKLDASGQYAEEIERLIKRLG